MDTGLWNERYGAADRLWSGNPHSQLPEIVAGMQPGSALDIACGEGADALWLAEQGWNVTAVDSAAWPSSVLAGPHPNVPSPLEFKVADLDVWVPKASFDLIVEFYLHVEPERRTSLHRRLQPFVREAGRYLTVGHHPDHAQ
jgi:2-polyprenyl-3-methyl-5-hydroxy-6-metoxy-1,4-benzoquinol methylase